MPSEDSKPVKKEEVEDDDDERSLGSLLREKGKKKPVSTSNAASKLTKPNKEENADFDSPQKKPTPKAVKPKKEESPAIDSADDKSRLKKSAAKDDKSKIKKKEEVKDKKNEGEVKKKERKVYDLPGQKRDPPEERDPLRIFYESLYEQVSDSEMAAIWMMESGLLPKDIAKQVYERKQKKSQMQKFGSPMKASSVSATKRVTQSSTTVKKAKDTSSSSSTKKTTTTTKKVATATKTKKRKKDESSEEEDEDEDSEDDFVVQKTGKRQRTTGGLFIGRGGAIGSEIELHEL